MFIVMDDNETKVQPDAPAADESIPSVDAEVELLEARAVIRKLESACYEALQLRGIFAAVNDPLALQGEKEHWREKYRFIETEIRLAIEKSRQFKEEYGAE
jgi:hypothetical protein